MSTLPAAKVERWQRFRDNRNKALAARHGWLTLTSFQWLEDSPAAVELVPGLWSTDGTTAFLTAAPADGLTLVETGGTVDGTISAALADEESLLWVQFGGAAGQQVRVELAMRGGKYALRTRDSTSPVFTGFDGVPTFEYRPDLVIEARFLPYPEPVDVPIRDESIRLGQFLKLANLIESGSEAKPLVAGGAVEVNGEVETRRGRQLVRGDVVTLGGQSARVADEGSPDNLPW